MGILKCYSYDFFAYVDSLLSIDAKLALVDKLYLAQIISKNFDVYKLVICANYKPSKTLFILYKILYH